MKDKFLKLAGVETEEEFYNMFPSEEAFFQAYPEARQMKKGGNVPTNPQLYSRVKSEAKQKFDRWPSAYGSAWLVKTYKSRGGGYRKAQNGMEMNPDANIQEYGQNVLDYANSMVPTMIPMNPNQQSSGSSDQGMASFAMQMLPMLMAEGGKMPQWLAEKRFKAAGNQSMMDSYGYARGGQPCYECGGMVKRMDDGGEPDGEMALGQLMSIMEKAEKLRQFIGGDTDLEPWVSSKITMADDYIDSISDYLMYSEDNGRDIEVEEEEDYNMGEMEQMAKGGIPQRYKNKGFTKVGVKRQSTRPGKKWMVLAKKGDKYKVVHGGYKGMKDFSQHGSEKRKDKFWSRMGGKNSAKATDPFSPLYWHKRFGTWAEGGEPQNPGFQALPDYVQDKIMSNMAYGGDMESMYQMIKGGMYQDGGQQQEQIMQAIQAYAQMTQTDPNEIMKQLQSMPPEEQQKALEQIMKAIQESQFQMKKGGIYIDPAKKGTFKAQATKMGMGVQEAAKTILNAPEGKYSPEMRKKANFARNFAKQEGGQIGMGDTMELDESEIQRLMDMGYGVEYID